MGPPLLACIFTQGWQPKGRVGPPRAAIPLRNHQGLKRRPIKGADDGGHQIPDVALGDEVREIVWHAPHQVAHDREGSVNFREISAAWACSVGC